MFQRPLGTYRIQRGRLLAHAGKWTDAEDQLSLAVSAHPSAEALYLIGNAQFHQKKFGAALELTQRALEQGGAPAAWLIRLGALYARFNRWEEAITAYERAVSLDTSRPEWEERLGHARRRAAAAGSAGGQLTPMSNREATTGKEAFARLTPNIRKGIASPVPATRLKPSPMQCWQTGITIHCFSILP